MNSPSNPKSPLRHLAPKFALSLTVLVACVIAIELSYRVRLYGANGLSPAMMNSIQPLGNSGLIHASELEGLIYELKPGMRKLFKLVPFRTNSVGMRDEEYSLEKPADVFRIAIIGDSFTMGSGVAIEAVYHSLLEKLLNERAHGRRYQCLNFGVGGYGLEEYLAVLEDKALRFNPDLILVGLTRTDRLPTKLKEFHEQPLRRPFWRLNFVDSTLDQWRVNRLQQEHLESQQLSAGDTSEGNSGQAAKRELSDYILNHMRRGMTSLVRSSRRAQVPLLAVYLRIRAQESNDEHSVSHNFGRFTRQAGAPFLDVGPAFEGLPLSDLKLFPNDAHPNADAQVIFARTILNFLDETDLLSN